MTATAKQVVILEERVVAGKGELDEPVKPPFCGSLIGGIT
jgi:hypothetical protein